jgi:hypothetical protein
MAKEIRTWGTEGIRGELLTQIWAKLAARCS